MRLAVVSRLVVFAACAGCSGGGNLAPTSGTASLPIAAPLAALAVHQGQRAHSAVASPLPGVGAYETKADVGINVEGVVDFSVAQQFVDAMRQARPWGSPATPYDEAVAHAGEIDANGWPTVDSGVLVLCCVASDGSATDPGTASELSGTYQLSFTGKANVTIPIDTGAVTGYAYDPATNLSTASVTFTDTTAAETLYLSFTNTQRTPTSPVGSGITDVHLIRPQIAPNGMRWWTTSTQRFTDPFLATLRGYSTLRFMDWAATNGSPVVNWSDRTPESYATEQRQIAYDGGFAPTGASWGDAIALANATKEDMWINIPAMASDAYVKSLARVIRAQLQPNLHVYVEYSNEVWNASFPQFAYNLGLAESEAQTNPAYKANCSPTDEYRWGQCRVAERLMQIAQDFASVDGPSAIDTTIRPVFATQENNTYDLGGALAFIATTYGTPSSFFYAVAQAPYWEGDQSLDGQTAGQELQAAETSLDATVPSSTADFTAYAVAYGLHNFTYEGGPGMYGTPSLAAKIAANVDPRMGSQVTHALTDFFVKGGDMFVYYDDTGAYGQYGMWGTTQDVFDRVTPKIDAIGATIGTEQIRSVGAMMPGAINALKYAFEAEPGGYAQPTYFYFRNGESLAYLVEAPAAGNYTLTLTEGTYATTSSLATISIGGVSAGSIVIPTTGGNPANTVRTAPLSIRLPQGLSIVDVAETSGEFALYKIGVASAP
jgi:hypothetical protein